MWSGPDWRGSREPADMGNRTVMRFVARTDLPGSRQFRNAWTLKQEIET